MMNWGCVIGVLDRRPCDMRLSWSDTMMAAQWQDKVIFEYALKVNHSTNRPSMSKHDFCCQIHEKRKYQPYVCFYYFILACKPAYGQHMVRCQPWLAPQLPTAPTLALCTHPEIFVTHTRKPTLRLLYIDAYSLKYSSIPAYSKINIKQK